MNNPDQLLADLQAAGLTVVQEPGWKTRGGYGDWATNSKPEGVCQHHTAPPNPYPIKALYRNDQIKCNMATHEDGTLYLVAYRRCNYSTGSGSSVVLKENVRKSTPPTANARQRGLVDDMGGNRYFWNYENSHPGDGSPIPDVQLQTIIISNWIVNAHFGLTYGNIISHAEWSRRKIDPRWNGSNRTAINQIREGVQALEEEVPEYRSVLNVPDTDWARGVVDNCIDKWKIINVTDNVVDDWDRDMMTDGRYWTFMDRALRNMHPDA